MGKSYATLRWGSGINGDDVEFVFGTFALETGEEQLRPDFQRRAIRLFLLDFRQCESVDLTEDPQTVYQAFKGAMVMSDNQVLFHTSQTTLNCLQHLRRATSRREMLSCWTSG